MALQLPANLRNDIQWRNTNLVPTIWIGSEDTAIRLSVGEYVNDYGTLPLLLNIPSIKESVNLETRKYKISSVTLDVSNLLYDGKRLSERISEQFDSFINTECRIFWNTPSSNKIWYNTATAVTEGDGALQVYNGIVRRYEHTDEKVRITLEDKSQELLHLDFPLKNLSGEGVPDKYKNKPYPMVYGHVDRSPCVIGEQSELGEIKIYPDSKESSTRFNPTETNPLMAYRDDKYIEIISSNESIITHWGYSNFTQYIVDPDLGILSTTVNLSDSDDLAVDIKSPIGEDLCAVKLIDTGYRFKLYTSLDNYSPPESEREYAFKATSPDDMPEIYRTNIGGGDITTFYEYRIQLIFDLLNK